MFILFFAAFTFTSIFADYSHGTFVVERVYSSNDRGSQESRFHHDFSNSSTSDFSYHSHPAKIATSRNQFNRHTTVNDFQHHFAACGYTESQILNQRCLYMFDEFVKFAQTYSSYKCTVQQLYTELKNLNCLQKAYYITKGTYCVGLQKRMQFLCNELNRLKTVQSSNDTIFPYNPTKFDKYVELATKNNHTLTIFQAQLPEYNTLDFTYRTYVPSLSNAIEKRVEAYSSLNNVDVRCATKSYNIHTNVKQLLSRHGHDIAPFNECFGNALDHTIHYESLDILDRIDFLSPNSILYDHQDALVDFAVAIVDYNHEGLTDKAIHIADLCWTLLDYGQAVVEGAALGVYSAAADIINNPIEATVCIIAGKQVLVYQLCKVLYNVADIGITAITDSDHAKEKWNSYVKPLNNIIDAIDKKEITLRDVIKGGTTFVVGLRAQSKLLGGLGKFCNTIKQKSLTFVQKNPLFSPQEYLATPEGLLFKATSQSNKLKSSGQVNASNLKNSVESKVAKNNSIKGLVKAAKLPITGKLRYVPPKKFHVSDGLPRVTWHDRRVGIVDRFGNVWLRGESRTKGQDFEWDVQLSKQGIQQVGWMTRDNSHLNVSLDGRVTHK